tara:strand:+ start:341 stop:655 length:315 start_codon:yes stop_codon:yes gene_type:complete
MIDTDKYEPTRIDTLLHNTRAHRTNGWRELSKSLIELSDDDRLLIEYAPTLRAEVERLREELKQTRESLWWCYDNYRFDGHPMTDVDWNFIGNLLGADMESEEE